MQTTLPPYCALCFRFTLNNKKARRWELTLSSGRLIIRSADKWKHAPAHTVLTVSIRCFDVVGRYKWLPYVRLLHKPQCAGLKKEKAARGGVGALSQKEFALHQIPLLHMHEVPRTSADNICYSNNSRTKTPSAHILWVLNGMNGCVFWSNRPRELFFL